MQQSHNILVDIIKKLEQFIPAFMAPKTRTGRKRDRRKIGKYYVQEVQEQQQQQQQQQPEEGAEQLLSSEMGENDVTKAAGNSLDSNYTPSNNISHQGDDGKQHPPDCPCILRKLGKDLFLPPSTKDLNISDNNDKA